MFQDQMMNNSDNEIIEIFFQHNLELKKIKCLSDELMESIFNKYIKNSLFMRDSLLFYFQNKVVKFLILYFFYIILIINKKCKN